MHIGQKRSILSEIPTKPIEDYRKLLKMSENLSDFDADRLKSDRLQHFLARAFGQIFQAVPNVLADASKKLDAPEWR